jgi:hypothetical protein
VPKGFQLMLADFTRGLPPWVIDWFLHSKMPLAQENRDRIKAQYAQMAYNAAIEQRALTEHMKNTAHLIDPKAPIRPMGIFHPFYAQDYRNRFGSPCLNNKEFLEDCRKTAPQLFYPK